MNLSDRRKSLVTDAPMYESVKRNSWPGGKFAIVTAGDDTQGMNAAIRGATRMGMYLGAQVFYIKDGFKGLVDGGSEIFEATWKDTSGIMGIGGTILKSFKCPEFMERSGRLKAAKNLIENGLQNIIAIGGDGTMKGISVLYNEWNSLLQDLESKNLVDKSIIQKYRQLKIILIPASITNDVCGTEHSIGIISALHRIIEATDAIESTSSSSQLAFVVQVMGSTSGRLALATGLMVDASMTFIPEWPPEGNWRDVLCDKIKDDILLGSEGIMCVMCEGSIDSQGKPITPEEVRDTLVSKLSLNAKITVLGHVQRGGSPTAYDRLLATRMGVEAVCALKDETAEEGPGIMVENSNQIMCLPMSTVLDVTNELMACIKNKNFAEAVNMRGQLFQEMLSAYKLMQSLRSSPMPCIMLPSVKKIGMIRLGRSTMGQCMVTRAIVGYCHSKNITALGFNDGFQSVVDRQYRQLCWKDVKKWAQTESFCLGSSNKGVSEVGLDKVAAVLEELELFGLILIGSFLAYQSLAEIYEAKEKYRSLCIPICYIPVTLVNNIPGCDLTIGADTAVNEITVYCDKLKRVARGQSNRVFVIETMGQNCGYLATLSGICSGADAAYISQEKVNLDRLLTDAAHLRQKVLYSGISEGLIVCGELANNNYNLDFIHKLFTEEGKGVYTCRASAIGYVQIGGLPSVKDRIRAVTAGVMAAKWISSEIDSLIDSTGKVFTVNPKSKSVMCFYKSDIIFTPVTHLIAETNFKEKLPTYLPWMKLRPLLRILAKHEEEKYEPDFMDEVYQGADESHDQYRYPVDV